nr:uncharacterized protein LOC129143089 [Pan troglodytes]
MPRLTYPPYPPSLRLPNTTSHAASHISTISAIFTASQHHFACRVSHIHHIRHLYGFPTPLRMPRLTYPPYPPSLRLPNTTSHAASHISTISAIFTASQHHFACRVSHIHHIRHLYGFPTPLRMPRLTYPPYPPSLRLPNTTSHAASHISTISAIFTASQHHFACRVSHIHHIRHLYGFPTPLRMPRLTYPPYPPSLRLPNTTSHAASHISTISAIFTASQHHFACRVSHIHHIRHLYGFPTPLRMPRLTYPPYPPSLRLPNTTSHAASHISTISTISTIFRASQHHFACRISHIHHIHHLYGFPTPLRMPHRISHIHHIHHIHHLYGFPTPFPMPHLIYPPYPPSLRLPNTISHATSHISTIFSLVTFFGLCH